MGEVTFRIATEADVPLIFRFIMALAEYESLTDMVTATQEGLRESVFNNKQAEVFFAVVDGVEVGYALFFQTYSTFAGRAGIFLEDLFVLPEYRGKGYGKAILQHLARITLERGCTRLEWWCLDWNKPSIAFYLSLGAQKLDQWTAYRLTETALSQLAEEK
ncbi:MAG: GNAT family N-acetyltransferase [Clostridiales bacterium 43-6]|nr:MAG: GNAT family N-acetyltransferase [Clostridiales bacterium 43-6]